MRVSHMIAAGLGAAWALSSPAWSGEQPAGDVLETNGLQVIGVYLQPVEMEPAMPDQDPTKTDIHLEADIHALADNPHRFPEGAWIPYLTVRYELTKKGAAWSAKGLLHPMQASDGPHYGANVKLDGAGAYSLTLHIMPPSPQSGYMRHTDKETGIPPWFEAFDYTGDFKFVGTGKKGGY